jgi:hypothetical protein
MKRLLPFRRTKGPADTTRVCASCGRPLLDHGVRDVRFELPDVLMKPPKAWRPLIAGTESLLEVRGVAGFVRVLLPVRLSGGASLRIGTWLRVKPDTFRHVREVFDEPAYTTLRIEGELGNAMWPWGPDLLGAPAVARVLDQGQIPWVAESSHALLRSVLNDEWPHEEVFAAFRHAL